MNQVGDWRFVFLEFVTALRDRFERKGSKRQNCSVWRYVLLVFSQHAE